jgi:hypothetical protein
MKPKKLGCGMQYKLLKDSTIQSNAKAGMMVYTCKNPDYGVANHDTRMTGEKHISVTLDPEGGYPFFTVRVSNLEEQDQW